MKQLLVTGSLGLVGWAVCKRFLEDGWEVTGLDDGSRATYFGGDADTMSQLPLLGEWANYHHWPINLDHIQHYYVRKFDAIVHAAAQPSHDWAGQQPLRDFEVNALGTVRLLEVARVRNPEAPFVFLSTNKVYGDHPNLQALECSSDLRWDFKYLKEGVSEEMSVDQCTHSPFGAGKLAADTYVQEYGRYYGMPTCCLRCGCLTGENHRGVELHGFLNYLVKCALTGKPYKIYGYLGKQVRDNLHASDVANFIWEFIQAPAKPGEVFNLGGGKENSCSILEAARWVRHVDNKELKTEYVSTPRKGDHICYYSDLRKCRATYPKWQILRPLSSIFFGMVRKHYEDLRRKGCQ